VSGREPIAIVGAGCRFPGADGPTGFWRALDRGHDGVGPSPGYRDGGRITVEPWRDRRGAAARGALSDVERFDWRAFRMSPRESVYIDPQQRLLLQMAWEALEHAGMPFESVAGSRAGVYVGIMWPDYAKMLAVTPSRLAGYAATGAGFALAANRLSYQFDLRGPSVALDVQCASSLTAVHLACASIWAGESELALAGGVNLILTPDADVVMSRAGFLSPSSRTRPLDASADGFVRGEGAGLLVLKPLSRARADGDRVLAVVLGSAVNHDGRSAPLTTPSRESQVDLISAACASAGIAPADLGYVELHAAGTQRGDPLEAQAVSEARGEDGLEAPCLIGSVKGNIGHCESAAGVASVTKVALALRNRRIPPTLNHACTHPASPLTELGLRLVTAPTPWPEREGEPAIAGVNGLSLGGGNAHVVLAAPEEAGAAPPGVRPRRRPEPQLLAVSAVTRPALAALARAYADELAERPAEHEWLADLVYTAALRRSHHDWRVAVVGDEPEALAAELRAAAAEMTSDDGHALGDGPRLTTSVAVVPSDPAGAERWVELDAVPGVGVLDGEARADGVEELVALPARPTRADLLRAVARLYELGCTVRWERVAPATGTVVDAPTYRWAGERMWVEPEKPKPAAELAGGPAL
jgi:acyl transferase domain-containing protein